MKTSLSWNCMPLKRNWTICQCDLVFVYSHGRRQKKRAMWMRLAEHFAKGQEGMAASVP